MYEEQLKKHNERIQDELIEIFILIEENTMHAKVQALTRYSRLYQIKEKLKANDKMKEAYNNFKK